MESEGEYAISQGSNEESDEDSKTEPMIKQKTSFSIFNETKEDSKPATDFVE